MYSQKDRPLAISTPLGPDALLLVGLRGRMALSELFRFDLDLLAPRDVWQNEVPFEKLLGQPVSVRLAPFGGIVQHFHGIVSRLKRVRRDQFFTRYQAEMVPRFWLMTRNTQCRVFNQQWSIKEILTEVLKELRPDLVLDLKGTYQPRNYCVQYQESDFAFASRLMEQEGIYYYFRHAADKHVLVLTDSLDTLKPLEPGVLHFKEAMQAAPDELCVSEWEKEQEVRAGRFTSWDQSFELTGHAGAPSQPAPQGKSAPLMGFQNLQGSQALKQSVTVGSVTHALRLGVNDSLEIFEYPGGFAHRFDGVAPGGGDRGADLTKVADDAKRLATIRIEEEATRGLLVQGASNYAHLQPGYKFTLKGSDLDDGAYVLTRVEHEASLADYRSGVDSAFTYRNCFECLPVDLPYRSERRTPRPVVNGVQTATVVGPAGQEIFVDKYGRVKVQFHWDRQGKFDADSSCWVRVAQVWAGRTWGAFFWPRVGHEVVVTFVDGDPDRPLIVGSVYNAANMPPVDLPDEAMAGGFKSCIFGGDSSRDFNAFVFYDIPGTEYIQLHSMRSDISKSMRNKVEYVPKVRVSFHGDFD